MPEIPKQLRDEKFRFILIKEGTKVPLEKDWQLSNNYKWNEEKFLKYKGSWGIVCGFGGLTVIDIDKKDLYQAIWLTLPKTFTILTGSKKWHMYYIIPDLKEKIVINDDKGIHRGEVQFLNSQVIGCGSKHPNGEYYKIDIDLPIAEITKKRLIEVLKPFLKTEKLPCNSGMNWDIAKIAKTLSGLDKNSDGSLQGSHPVHGSVTGKNFNINLEKGVWHCFRCGTGGDAASLIGVLEGIIDCEDCKAGFFKEHSEKFTEITKAASKYGYEYDNSIVDVWLIKTDKKGNVKKSLNTKGIVEGIKQEYTFITVKDETGKKPQLYYYQNGYYHTDGWFIIEQKVKDILKNDWTKKRRDEIVDYLKTENVINRDEIDNDSNYINLKNGIYNLKQGKLISHDPTKIFLYQIPWNYDPKIKTCPKIIKFFNDTLNPEFVKISLEIYGYCLLNDYRIASIFYLYGGGGNGKTVWTTILMNLLGIKNISSTETQNLAKNRFSGANLYCKKANLCGELGDSEFKDTTLLKGLTGESWITVEMKGRDPFQFKNTAKIISSCNSVPHCQDYSTGWIERQFVIPFLKHFRGEKNEVSRFGNILASDEKEMQGLLYISIEALKILIKNNKFSYEGYQDIYLEASHTIKNFIELHIERSNVGTDILTFREIYDKCNIYCKSKNLPTPNENELSRALTYMDWRTDSAWKNGKTIRVKRFIKWKKETI